jgi:hypothetical protein
LPASDPGTVLAIDFFAAELQLRGSAGVIQPHGRNGDILFWNGEVGLHALPLAQRTFHFLRIHDLAL